MEPFAAVSLVATSTPGPLLPEMMFRAAAVVPPIMAEPVVPSTATPKFWFASAVWPVAVVPIRFPSITEFEALNSQTPAYELPAITLPAPVSVPPTLLLVLLSNRTPTAFPRAVAPLAWVPIRFPSRVLPLAPPWINTPALLLPEIRFRVPGSVPPIKLLLPRTKIPVWVAAPGASPGATVPRLLVPM